MTEQQLKYELVNRTVEAIKKHKGCLLYNDIIEALLGKKNWSPGLYAVFFLEMSVICHNIPKFNDNAEKIREVFECFNNAITFAASNIAERDIVAKSLVGALIDKNTGDKIGILKFFDDTHEVFTFGKGNSNPDLVDELGTTYEVKRNYEGGSPSSLHAADFLLNCKTNTVEKYKVFFDTKKTGSVNIHFSPDAKFANVLSDKISKPAPEVLELLGDVMSIIYSGELILEIEQQLKLQNFKLYI